MMTGQGIIFLSRYFAGAGGGRNSVHIISLVWRIKVYLGLEDQREWRINTNLLTRFGGSRLGEDKYLSRFEGLGSSGGSILIYLLGLEDQGWERINIFLGLKDQGRMQDQYLSIFI